MEAKKYQKHFTLLLGATLAVGLISFTGCDREEREHLADQFGDKVVEAIHEENSEAGEAMDDFDCDPSVEDCGEREEPENNREGWEEDDGTWEDADSEEREENDGAWEENDGVWEENDGAWEENDGAWEENDGAWEENNGQWDYFAELEDLELSNARIGGQFGEANKPQQEGVFEGFDEGGFTQIDLWSEDRRSMFRIELFGGISHDFFQTPGQKLIIGEEPNENIMVAGLDVIVSTCYGDAPYEIEYDYPADKITVVTVDGGAPGVVSVYLNIEAFNPELSMDEQAFASFDVTQVK